MSQVLTLTLFESGSEADFDLPQYPLLKFGYACLAGREFGKAAGTHTMKYIATVAVIAIVALQYSGLVPNSSVGGPLTMALVVLAAAVAVGIHEAWTMKRGVLGWIVNIVASIVGSLVAAEVGDLIAVPIVLLLSQVGSLADAAPLPFYVAIAAWTLLMIAGSWLALQFINRWR